MHHSRLISTAVALGMLASALPAAAASGDVVSIALRDFNHNGKIDRAVVAIANPDHAAWSVRDASGIAVSIGGVALSVSDVFMASASADPALLEIVLDEDDARLPVSTSADAIEVAYAKVGASGVSAGGVELAAFAADDASPAVTEKDEAAPILLSSNPAAGSIDVYRGANLLLSFSETLDAASLAPVSTQNPGAWSFTASGSSVTVGHFPYANNADESFGIAGRDLAGNAIVSGPYPNPFRFRTTDDASPTTRVDNVFALTSPAAFAALPAGGPAIVTWYSNQDGVAEVRLSSSTDAGQSYATIARLPASRGSYVWYPPAITASFQLRLEGLNASGVPIASSFVSPVSLTGTAPSPVVLSGPVVDRPSESSALVTVTLDRAPASASLECAGLSPVAAALSGDRPVRAEATLTGLTAGPTYACVFVLKDAAGVETRLTVPPLTPEPDTSGPVLIGPAVIDRFDAAARTAKLSWTTDEPSRAEISYGLELNFSGRAESAALATSHEITLLDLTPGAMHQARITSIDATGNVAVSRDWYFVFLREGDLIKGSGPAVYWHKGGKRYVFPHLEVYRSWFGDDFSKVIRVSDTQLGTIALGGNMPMKEGVFLVKIQSDPKTYAVEPDGVLRWIQTEAHARQLYGDAWAKRVRDVDVSLFSDYVIGPPLESGEKPAGYAN